MQEQDMKIALFVFALIAFLLGFGVLWSVSQREVQSAVQEMEALIFFLIGAVFFSSAGVVESIDVLRKELATILRQVL
jgi:hypothetical protein